MLRVYVAAPYALAPFVRDVHSQLTDLGCKPVSTWAELATGAEKLSDAAARVSRVCWEINTQSIDSADVLLALSTLDGGAEMFADIGRALYRGTPVLWTGARRILSCYAPEVILCRTQPGVRGIMYEGLDEALDELAKAAKAENPKAAREMLLRPRVTVGPAHLHAIGE
jgi:hypothetical protein